jgi:ubiquinone/menaquinone biosynthesis C-methylase UbiE
VVKNDIEEAKKILGMSDQNITCILNPDPVLMLPDSSQDIIYSISVIEHMDSVDVIAAEFARLLKSDGRLILTFDLDLRGDRQIQPKEYEILKKTLSSYFEPCFENRLIHPVTMLTSVNSPYPLTSGWRYRLSNYLKNIVRPMVGKNKVMYPSYMLACELLVLKKKVIDL